MQQPFRRLLTLGGQQQDVQNIDLMILAGFCRNCFSKWYKAEAEQQRFRPSYLILMMLVSVFMAWLTMSGNKTTNQKQHQATGCFEAKQTRIVLVCR